MYMARELQRMGKLERVRVLINITYDDGRRRGGGKDSEGIDDKHTVG